MRPDGTVRDKERQAKTTKPRNQTATTKATKPTNPPLLAEGDAQVLELAVDQDAVRRGRRHLRGRRVCLQVRLPSFRQRSEVARAHKVG